MAGRPFRDHRPGSVANRLGCGGPIASPGVGRLKPTPLCGPVSLTREGGGTYT